MSGGDHPIQRYSFRTDYGSRGDANGEWVKYADHEKEIAEWQQSIYEVCKAAALECGKPDHVIDGAGSDGDELEFTLAEIKQAFGCFRDALADAQAQYNVKPVASQPVAAPAEDARLEEAQEWFMDTGREIVSQTNRMEQVGDFWELEPHQIIALLVAFERRKK